MAPPRVVWCGESFRLQSDSPGREIHCPILPTGDPGSSLREAAPRRAWLPGPCAQGPRTSPATCGGRWRFGPKRVPGTSQRREVDVVSLAPGISLYPSSSWRPGRRRRGKRGGKAGPEQLKSRGGGAPGTLRARGLRVGSQATIPSPPCAAGAPPPWGTHPAAPNLENKGSGKHGRGRRTEVEGGRKAGGGGRGGRLPALPFWAE